MTAENLGRGRIEALSDGVFAIVVTLLVLEIKVPHVAAHDSLAELAGALLMMALAFVLMRGRMRRHPDLLQAHADRDAFARGTVWSVTMGPLAYAVGAGLAWIDTRAAFACYAAIALYFVFPHAVRER